MFIVPLALSLLATGVRHRHNRGVSDATTQQRESTGPQPGSRDEMRLLRKQSNWVNMAIALLACMALVAVALMIAPQPKGNPTRTVDAAGVASAAAKDAGFTPLVPQLPDQWTSNAASLEKMGKPEKDTWYVSNIGPDQQWITLRQAKTGSDEAEWVKSIVDGGAEVGTSSVKGVSFTQYQRPNQQQALVGQADGTTLVLMGTGSWSTFEDFASRTLSSASAGK